MAPNGGPHDGGQRTQPGSQFNLDFKPAWITSGFNDEANRFTEELGKFIANNKLTTSQIRNIFGEVKRIQMQLRKEDSQTPEAIPSFYLLRPKMAYAAGRQNNLGIREFKKYFDKAHQAVDLKNRKTYENFVAFLEAILAYHRINGGKDN